MELYDLKDKTIKELSLINTDKGLLFTDFLSDGELTGYGYKRVARGVKPETNELNTVVTVAKEGEKTFDISYEVAKKPLDELAVVFTAYVQGILDEKARLRGYDDIVSACSYAGYDNEFRAEGEAFGKWRARVWRWGYDLLRDIENKAKSVPTDLKEAVRDMPAFEEDK